MHLAAGKENWKEDLGPLGNRILRAEFLPEWAPIDFTESAEAKKIIESQVPTFLPNPDSYWGPGKKTKVKGSLSDS